MTPGSEAIAITGVGCRFPGGSTGPESFWQFLLAGRDGIGDIPADRWNVDAFYHPEPDHPGTMIVRQGGFLDHIFEMDASFFGVSPREAMVLDPQQRILLELTFEALENAGLPAEKLAGCRTGVFMGGFSMDFKLIQNDSLNRGQIGFHTASGCTATMLSNRLSFFYDFKGPSLTVDTACSSSLVATHLACRSLLAGESDVALAGGANIIIWPEWTVITSAAHFLSPDCRCRSFDRSANGYVRSEGAGVIVLKLLSRALRDGDRIYATILGSGINQDGYTPQSITYPGEESQKKLLGEILKKTAVDPEEIFYVEAHGTGTQAGDPVEARALGTMLSRRRSAGNELWIGSVKSNIGHTESASGIAGLIKAALCCYHGKIPPNLHFHEFNPEIPFSNLRLRVPTRVVDFPETNGRRLAAVNSFGYGGANANVIIQSPPSRPSSAKKISENQPQLFTLSAKSEKPLRDYARLHHAFLDTYQGSLADLCSHANCRRSQLPCRLALKVSSLAELREKLSQFIQGQEASGIFQKTKQLENNRDVVMVCSGNGPQWWAMGRDLFTGDPVFKKSFQQAAEVFQELAPWSLEKEFTATQDQSRIGETQIAQPVIFALQVALAEWWKSRGITPAAVIGHSVGEAAAAYIAGILPLDQAARIVYHRSRLQQRTAGQGTLLAVNLTYDEAGALIKNHSGQVSICAQNSPQSVTLSGDQQALEAIQQKLKRENIFNKFLNVNIPFHSPQLESLREELLASLQELTPQAGSVPFYSTVRGELIAGGGLTSEYWYQNLRQPVLFAPAIQKMIRQGLRIFLELSAHPVLLHSIGECLQERPGLLLASLRHDEPGWVTGLNSLCQLVVQDYPVDWMRLYPDYQQANWVDLPGYPWQREYYLGESEASRSHRQGQNLDGPVRQGPMVHPLLGRRLRLACPVWENNSFNKLPRFLRDHQVLGNTVFPGAAYLEMALAGASDILGRGAVQLAEVEFKKALFMFPDREQLLQLISQDNRIFSIHSATGGNESGWTEYCRGEWRKPPACEVGPASINDLQKKCPRTLDRESCYGQFKKMGLEYGPAFQGLDKIWLGENQVLARLAPRTFFDGEAGGYHLHPALIDACFQALLAVVSFSGEKSSQIYLPVKCQSFSYFPGFADPVWVHGEITGQSNSDLAGQIRLYSDSGSLIMEVGGFMCQSLNDVLAAEEVQDLFRFNWLPKENAHGKSPSPSNPGSWLVLDDNQGMGEKLAGQLRDNGQVPLFVSAGQAFSRQRHLFTLRPSQAKDWEKLLQQVNSDHDIPPLRGILHLWSLDCQDLAQSEILAGQSLLTLISVLNRLESHPQLLLLTRGSMPAADRLDENGLFASILWGMGRVVMNEQPEFQTRLLDLDPGDNDWPGIVADILNPDGEEEVAFRDSQRWVHRLQYSSSRDLDQLPLNGANSRQIVIRPDRTYLVTGGLKGFGFSAAQWLAGAGARNLVLVSRSGSTPAEIKTAISRMEKAGTKITTFAADIGDSQAVSRLFAKIKDLPPLAGVIHAANQYADASLLTMTPEQFHQVLKTKAQGAWNLHLETGRLQSPLDFMVFFSSIAGIIGNPGQANYAAANVFLDTLAQWRQNQGTTALAVNWGAIADAGYLARNEETKKQLEKNGMRLLPSAIALNILGQIWQYPIAGIAVAKMDWPHWATRAATGQSPRWSELTGHTAGRDSATASSGKASPPLLLQEWQGAAAFEQAALLRKQIEGLARQVLGLTEKDKLDERSTFSEMGMDSMLSVEMRNRLASGYGCKLPAALLFKYPTLNQLAVFLTSFLAKSPMETGKKYPADTPGKRDLDSLPSGQLAELLRKELDTLRD